MIRSVAMVLLGLPLMAFPSQATGDDGGLIGNIDSAVPEAQADCEALAESLRSRRDDNILNPAGQRELREKGC